MAGIPDWRCEMLAMAYRACRRLKTELGSAGSIFQTSVNIRLNLESNPGAACPRKDGRDPRRIRSTTIERRDSLDPVSSHNLSPFVSLDRFDAITIVTPPFIRFDRANHIVSPRLRPILLNKRVPDDRMSRGRPNPASSHVAGVRPSERDF